MSDNHIIGANEGPRTTRSGRHAAAHPANDLTFNPEDLRDIRENSQFIRRLRRLMGEWGDCRSRDPDQEARQRDNEQ